MLWNVKKNDERFFYNDKYVQQSKYVQVKKLYYN